MFQEDLSVNEIWYVAYSKPVKENYRPFLYLRGKEDSNGLKVHLEGGNRTCYLDELEVIETHAVKNYDEFEELEQYVIQKFHEPKTSKVFLSDGWISPKGDFYPCKPMGHDTLQLDILAYFRFEHCLEDLGWLKLSYSWGYILPHIIGYITKAQKEALFDFYNELKSAILNRDKNLTKYNKEFVQAIEQRLLDNEDKEN